MTVEQSSLQQHNSKRAREDGLSQAYAQIKEVTGIDDQRVIDEAISACRTPEGAFKVEDVVSMLIQDDTVRRTKQARPSKVSKTVSFQEEGQETPMKLPIQESAGKKNTVIDLTQEGEQIEINKAISASLQDTQGILGGQVTREEQDISRVLEASLAESKAGTKRKRGEVWFVDPLNPHERKRHENWPVGLKNIGNTCWFSAVIQSLFYLPKFRRMVLNFRCPMESSGDIQERRNLRFMKELRLLFGLMVGSTRKYVDPSKAVDILKEAFSSPSGITDSQQDVSEFQHKLLEWLEDAFKSDQSRPSPPAPPPQGEGGSELHQINPVTELFYGQFRAEGVHEGEKFTKQETFGQFPLQVNGFRDIHESLEATTMQDEIEAVNQEAAAQKSGQELWFTRLPPVLTFELSRFQFNQQLGRPEKIHNKIEFPRVIYVDRYLESNKPITRQRREQSRKLKDQLSTVQARLDRFMNYGSGSKRCPLQDVLQFALEFAQSRQPISTSPISLPSSDVDMESPKPPAEPINKDGSPLPLMRTACDSPDVSMSSVLSSASPLPAGDVMPSPVGPNMSASESPSVVDGSSTDAPRTGGPDASLTQALSVAMYGNLSGAQVPSWHDDPSSCLVPSPRFVTDAELRVLGDCLRRWRTEVENDVRELQTSMSTLESKLDKMYSDDSMQKFPYHLHAVLVHEGQAASGHYWAFIRDESRHLWLKFNDITISQSSWEELERESVGGYHNASAYCLMYVDRACIQDFRGAGEPSSQVETLDTLPSDLQEHVAADNKTFAHEIEDWDAEQAHKALTCDPEVTITAEHKPTQSTSSQTVSVPASTLAQPSLALCHAQLSFADTVRAVERVADQLQIGPPATALTKAAAYELKRLQGTAEALPLRLPREDARLRHMVVYLLCNQADTRTQHVVLLEQFAYLAVLDQNTRTRALRTTSCETIRQMKENGDSGYQDCEHWHSRYHQFREAAYMFVQGLQAYYKERFTEALPYFNQAWLHNRSALLGKTVLAGLNNQMISFYRRRCLQHVNEEAAQQFEMDSDVSDALTLMANQILPSLAFLSQSGLETDIEALEELRGKWCAFLEKELSEVKIQRLQDFLTKMFENFSDVKLGRPQTVRLVDMNNLYQQYTDVMNTAYDAGDIQQALQVR